MDTMNWIAMANASAGYVLGENSALKPLQAIVAFRARTRGGAALVDHSPAPDSAPWMHPAH